MTIHECGEDVLYHCDGFGFPGPHLKVEKLLIDHRCETEHVRNHHSVEALLGVHILRIVDSLQVELKIFFVLDTVRFAPCFIEVHDAYFGRQSVVILEMLIHDNGTHVVEPPP